MVMLDASRFMLLRSPRHARQPSSRVRGGSLMPQASCFMPWVVRRSCSWPYVPARARQPTTRTRGRGRDVVDGRL